MLFSRVDFSRTPQTSDVVGGKIFRDIFVRESTEGDGRNGMDGNAEWRRSKESRIRGSEKAVPMDATPRLGMALPPRLRAAPAVETVFQKQSVVHLARRLPIDSPKRVSDRVSLTT